MKISKLLRKWADKLDPPPPPRIQWPAHELTRYRIKASFSPETVGTLTHRYGSEARALEILRQETIVNRAVELAKIIEVEIKEGTYTLNAEFFIHEKTNI